MLIMAVLSCFVDVVAGEIGIAIDLRVIFFIKAALKLRVTVRVVLIFGALFKEIFHNLMQFTL